MADTVLLVYLGLTYVLTLVLGFLQTPAPVLLPPETDGRAQAYSAAAITLVCVQALVSALVCGGTVWFPVAAVWLAFTLLCHHAVIHRNSRFEGETCSCAPFQCKDVSNHETWVVAALVLGLGSALDL
jgi:hypothetical protein